MARKLPRLQRVLDAPALFSIAYGEIASSIYFALGIIAFHALGFTPGVLLLTGALFLDYLIVIALSALYVPHYAAAALFTNVKKPWDVVAGCGVIAAIAAFRLLRNKRIFRFALVIALVDLATQLLLVILGLALLFSPHALNQGTSLGSNPSWHSIAFALPLAMLAYTGLETVANLSEEMRSPGRDLPRSVFGAIGLAVLLYAAIAVVGLSAFPAGHGTQLGSTWAKAPLMGIVSRLRDHLPNVLGAPLQVFVGTTGALILVTAAATSIAGFGRLAYSLGEHGQLPRVFGRLSRRSVIAPQSIIAAALISMALLVTTSAVLTHPIFFLASLYSFGVLLAFTAAQLAVIKLRFSHPKKRRPYRVPLNWGRVPVPAVVGAILTALVWILALATHAGARYGGPVWLAAGLLLYILLRHSRGEGLTERVVSADEHPDLTEAQYSSILVPLKLGPIGEEMVATAVKLAQESGASVWALHVVRVPMERPLEEELPDEEESAAAALAEAQLLGSDHGVEVKGKTVRARSIGDAIVSQAKELGVDLIVLGSAPKWRRQSRFFSPTVEYVLKKAPCEVLVVAFPQGVLEAEEEESAFAATEASPELI